MASKEILRDLRQDYGEKFLEIDQMLPDPVTQLQEWFDEAVRTEGEIEPNAMTLATVDATGQPSARVVLLKEILDGELIYFTNYHSRKGRELQTNPKCTVVFWWRMMHRQVRVEGTVRKVDESYSKDYFRTRPIGSQLGAIVSPQSAVIPSRQVLIDALKEEEKKLSPGQLPIKPIHWGGYAIKPHWFEFWQGHTNRLHDRFQYRQQGSDWIIERLAP
ncbi:MAG: pyridoxamine 5'-phosphate oxidase [Saprospiraceae bacterium]|nr:pyridoxamine 5'-phosphate oxidase [Saprospiraceae bacterium]